MAKTVTDARSETTQASTSLGSHSQRSYPSSESPRFRCLIFDHDDTCVNSTATIHHPAHCAGVAELLPGTEPVSLTEWFRVNHDPGVRAYLKGLFGDDKAIHEREIAIWHEFMASRVPEFYPGILDLIRKFREAWREQGKESVVAVVSHSPAEIIEGHYRERGDGVMPDVIWGHRKESAEMKPYPWPGQQILKEFKLDPEECCLIDDLSPGIDMAVKCGITPITSAWAHCELVNALKERGSQRTFFSVEEFQAYVLNHAERGQEPA